MFFLYKIFTLVNQIHSLNWIVLLNFHMLLIILFYPYILKLSWTQNQNVLSKRFKIVQEIIFIFIIFDNFDSGYLLHTSSYSIT